MEDSDFQYTNNDTTKESRKRTKRKSSTQTTNKFDNLSLIDFKPLTTAQSMMVDSYNEGMNVIADGYAGVGKTYVATYLGLKDLFDGNIEKIIFVRSAVSIRSQGFLPGSQAEKEAVYTTPFKSIVDSLLKNGTAWEVLSKKGYIEFMTTTYIRGISCDKSLIIIEEFQNMDASEIESVLTRVGKDSKVIICGDARQNDLNRKREQSCHEWLLTIARKMPDWFDVITFYPSDIVRSEFCKQLIITIAETP